MFANFLLQICSQIGFLYHVNLHVTTDTVGPCIWNTAVGTTAWHVWGWKRVGDIWCRIGYVSLLKDRGMFWHSVNACWLSSQLFMQQITNEFHYDRLCLVPLIMATYTYSISWHLSQYSVGQCCVTSMPLGEKKVTKPLSIIYSYVYCLFRATSVAYGSSKANFTATATATQDPSYICDLHHNSWQCWILNPLIKARDQICVLMDASLIRFCWATTGIAL